MTSTRTIMLDISTVADTVAAEVLMEMNKKIRNAESILCFLDLIQGHPDLSSLILSFLGNDCSSHRAAMLTCSAIRNTYTQTNSGPLHIVFTKRRIYRFTTQVPSTIDSVRLSPDGQWAVMTGKQGSDRFVRVFDLATGTITQTMGSHEGKVTSTDYSPDGRQVVMVSAGEDLTVRLWNLATDVSSVALRLSEHFIVLARFTPDGPRAVAEFHDGSTVDIYDLQTGACLKKLETKKTYPVADFEPLEDEGTTAAITSAAFSTDGKLVATISEKGDVHVWDVETAELHMYAEECHRVGDYLYAWSVTFSPDGTRLVTAGGDGTARVLDLETKTCALTLTGHTSSVYEVNVDQRGLRVVTASADKTARVWDLATGTCLKILEGHDRAVQSAQFSPDGLRVATASNDDTVRVWEL